MRNARKIPSDLKINRCERSRTHKSIDLNNKKLREQEREIEKKNLLHKELDNIPGHTASNVSELQKFVLPKRENKRKRKRKERGKPNNTQKTKATKKQIKKQQRKKDYFSLNCNNKSLEKETKEYKENDKWRTCCCLWLE